MVRLNIYQKEKLKRFGLERKGVVKANWGLALICMNRQQVETGMTVRFNIIETRIHTPPIHSRSTGITRAKPRQSDSHLI